MAMNKTYKQWLIALVLVLFLVLFFEWLVNHNRKSSNRYNQNKTQRELTKKTGPGLWRGAAVYFNPEVSGGKGLSFTTGVAGALNGETYRVGATEPQVFIARS